MPKTCIALSVPVDIAAADGAESEGTLRKFSMLAYTGKAMDVFGWDAPVVVDLDGLLITAKPRPILKDHNQAIVIGHTTSITKDNGQLFVNGLISGTGRSAKELVADADNGFPWQASIGASVLKAIYIPEGHQETVNGGAIDGPVYIARQSKLGEVSFVSLGADDDTESHLLRANQSNSFTNFSEAEIFPMQFEAWLKAKSKHITELSETELNDLRAQFDAEQLSDAGSADDSAPATTHKAAPAPTPTQKITANAIDIDPVKELRARAVAENKRIQAIKDICAGKHSDIENRAIDEGWDKHQCELHVLRAERPQAPNINIPQNTGVNDQVLEAACLLSGNMRNIEAHANEQDLDQAQKLFKGQIGLQELLLTAARAHGCQELNFRNARDVMAAAFNLHASGGLSTINISQILSNVANKFLLEGFNAIESAWRDVTAIRNVTDFKTVSSHRMVGANQYELVAPGGELKHGKLGEQSYSNKADTYGLMLGIDRRDIINDDLGAISDVPRMIGRGAGLKINDVFWKVFLDHASFYTAAHKNLLTGASSALSIDGLTAAEKAFMEQVDPDGKPLGTMPAVLLVPPALSALASQLKSSMELRDTKANNKYPVANPHQGKFRTVVSRYLSNATFTGHSDSAWYLLAEAADLPVIETAFLNGQQSPTIESADLDFNQLGIQMRGYHDFGCNLQEYRGGVKSAP